MQYHFTDQPIKSAANSLAATIKQKLQNNSRVLWLLSGGSSLTIANLVAEELSGLDLDKLSVTMTDERYGEIGHNDENWQTLIDNGFSLSGAKLYRPLNGESRQKATANLAAWLKEELKLADYKIGIFGMGADGHTAGIKPSSSAVDSPDLAADFTGDDFERITITPLAIKQLDEAVIQISGADKKDQLQQLLTSSLPLNDQPAQALKSIATANIYSDIELKS